jgi:hypothetical protein
VSYPGWDRKYKLYTEITHLAINRRANEIVAKHRSEFIHQVREQLEMETGPDIPDELLVLEKFWKKRHRILLMENPAQITTISS